MPSTFASFDDFQRFQESLPDCFPHNPTEADVQFLDAVAASAQSHSTTMAVGTALFRAVRGCEWRDFEHNGEILENECILPHIDDRHSPFKIDDSRKLSDGRANPRGVPVFYLANDLKTAISETRPINKELISVAEYSVSSELRLADCVRDSGVSNATIERLNVLIGYTPESPKVIENFIWHEIGHAFSRPTSRSDAERDYLPTQVLSGLFRRLGFDGIRYQSEIFDSAGVNVALYSDKSVNLVRKYVYEAIVQQPLLRTRHHPDQSGPFHRAEEAW